MGIPAFYRWVKERYPKCVEKVKEDVPIVVNGVQLPIDTTLPNPNGVEFDNLYLDMNGIIHPCFHPEGLPAPKMYDEIFWAVFKYIDRIFSIVRPRKLLFLAIDGVAPRAKMNQQRSRRFKAARDAVDEALGRKQPRSDLESDGEKSSILEQSNKLDSNVITPGTEFMDLLSSALRYYIRLRMNNDLGWRGIKVILSDSSVLGEGEHKIMSYIRMQRNLPGYDPNTRHCLYGLDADLIMLALASHEIHFTILREEVRKKSVDKPAKKEKKHMKWLKKLEEMQMKEEVQIKKESSYNLEGYITRQKFQFLNIWILREYLAHDMRIPDSTVEADLERLIDDFVFMCLFVGNDFLPQIPSLEISEGAINLLLRIYTNEFVKRGGYLTDSSEVNMERVEHFFRSVGSRERKIFLKRRRVQEKERHEKARKARQSISNNKLVGDSSKLPLIEQITGPKSSSECLAAPVYQESQKSSSLETQNKSVNCTSIGTDVMVDKIKLGGRGYKERFYAEKFEAKTKEDHERIRRHAVFKYVEGVCWVMRYYYEGVCSWQWFYPYHYAPFASDFYGLRQLQIHFTLGEPFKPFEQLMGVLPAASAHALPLSYRKLMTDVSSPILEFYPTDFELDMNGKRFSWQAICKLPFIDESRLLSEIAKVDHTLTDEERRRNSLGMDLLFLHISHPLGVEINSFYKQINFNTKFLEVKEKMEIDPEISGGMNGCIYVSDRSVWPVEISSPVEGMKMITENEVLSVFYIKPAFHTHIPRPVFGVIFPGKSVCEQDILPLDILWLTKSARQKLSSSRRKFSQWPLPKPVLGPSQSELAEQLVSQCNLRKQTKILQCMKLGHSFDADGLEEVNQVGKSRKRKWSKDKHNEGVVPNYHVEKLGSYSVGEKRGDQASVFGSQGLRAEVNAEVTLGIKPEVKSKKRKRRSKKGKLSEGDDVPNKRIEKLECNSAGELSKGDGDQAIAVVLHGARIAVNMNGELESSSLGEQKQGDSDRATVVGLQGVRTEVNSDGLLGIKPEIQSRKKKRKSKKRKLSERNDSPPKIVEKLKSSTHEEPNTGDGIQVIAVGLQGAGTEINTDGKLESISPVGQNKGDGHQVTVELPRVRTEVNSDGLLGIKPRKKKRKSKKSKPSKGEGNKENGAQVNAAGLQGERTEVTTDGKLGSRSLAEQNKGDGDQVGLQGVRNDVNADGLLVVKPEVKPRKKNGRSRKRKPSEDDDGLPKSVEILDNGSLELQSKGDGVRANGSGLQGVRIEVDADGKLESSSLGEWNKRYGDQTSDFGLQGVGAEVNGIGLLVIKPEPDSRRRALLEGDAVPNISGEKLESISSREQNKGVQANVDMAQEMKIEVGSRGRKRRNMRRKQNKSDPSLSGVDEKLAVLEE